MKIERYFIKTCAIPLIAGSIILGASIDDMNTLHILGMVLLLVGGIFMGVGLKRN